MEGGVKDFKRFIQKIFKNSVRVYVIILDDILDVLYAGTNYLELESRISIV